MAGSSLQELNSNLLGEFLFTNHTLHDFSGNGNDLGTSSSEDTIFTHESGYRCLRTYDDSNYLTFPSAVTGSFTVEYLGARLERDDTTNFYLLYEDATHYINLKASSVVVNFGTTATSNNNVFTYPNSGFVHFVYTRSISSGPTLDNEYFYLNGLQGGLDTDSGTNDFGTDFRVFDSFWGGHLMLRIYDSYITQDEYNMLFTQARNLVGNERFPFPVSYTPV